MTQKKLTPPDFQTNSFDLSKTTLKIKISKVFKESLHTEISVINLFMAHFNTIPNYLNETKINCNKAHEWFINNFKNDIIDAYFNKKHYRLGKESNYEDIFYIIYDDLIVNFDMNQGITRFTYRKTNHSKVNNIIEGIKKFKSVQKQKSKISLLIQSNSGLELKRLSIDKPKLNILDNYNDDFQAVHKVILKRLKKENDKGLVLLHGKPGTGKTSYIRYLITQLKKDVIFLPPSMATALTNPNIITSLINNPNSIFVIEDAENIIMDRGFNRTSSVSTLLNLSDGLLSDCLNIQIICTFNIDISKVDNALLRKGRLIAKYDFQDLEPEKANRLSEKLGFNTKYNAATTLSLIYNQDEKNYQISKEASSIGFKTRNAG